MIDKIKEYVAAKIRWPAERLISEIQLKEPAHLLDLLRSALLGGDKQQPEQEQASEQEEKQKADEEQEEQKAAADEDAYVKNVNKTKISTCCRNLGKHKPNVWTFQAT